MNTPANYDSLGFVLRSTVTLIVEVSWPIVGVVLVATAVASLLRTRFGLVDQAWASAFRLGGVVAGLALFGESAAAHCVEWTMALWGKGT